MKKIIISVLISIVGFTAFAKTEPSSDFTLADFEVLVEKQFDGKSAFDIYGDKLENAYEYYAENGQCLIFDSVAAEEEIEKLFNKASN